jgi:hypothetical protein
MSLWMAGSARIELAEGLEVVHGEIKPHQMEKSVVKGTT